MELVRQSKSAATRQRQVHVPGAPAQDQPNEPVQREEEGLPGSVRLAPNEVKHGEEPRTRDTEDHEQRDTSPMQPAEHQVRELLGGLEGQEV